MSHRPSINIAASDSGWVDITVNKSNEERVLVQFTAVSCENHVITLSANITREKMLEMAKFFKRHAGAGVNAG